MNVLEMNYFHINRNINRFLGSWPYQKRSQRYIARFLLLLLHISGAVPEIIHLVKVRANLPLLIDCLPIFLTHIILAAKYLNYIYKEREIKLLFDQIMIDWNKNVPQNERRLMAIYMRLAEKLTRFMFYMYYICTALYLAIPLMPRILDSYFPLNETRPFVYVFEFDYLADPVKNFIPIYLHQCVLAVIMLTFALATDTTYGFFIAHACSMFAILKNKLKNLASNHSNYLNIDRIEIFENSKDCIKKHIQIITYFELMEFAHSSSLFFIMGTSVFSLTMTGLQVMTHINEPTEAFRFACFSIGHLMHIFFYAWNSQRLMDHSSAIHHAAYSGKWYRNLSKSSNLLTMVMVRSRKVCVQTAGKVFPLTLMNFTVIVKTSMSYFTVLSNVPS